MNHQLALPDIKLNEEATFSSFCWGENTLLRKELTSMLDGLGESFVYLWGNKGIGKSHLLQAACHALSPHQSTLYLPLTSLKNWDPAVLTDLELYDLFCIDDISAIAGMPAFEEALFHLYNRIRDNQKLLIVADTAQPRHSNIKLPDLRSRLSSGLIIQIKELSDPDKIETLSLEARRRGFELPHSVAQFLVNRSARNMHDLYLLLDRLDEASLALQRKITIPFIKTILNW